MVLPRDRGQWHLAVGNINLDISLYVPRLPEPEEVVFAEEAWIGLGGAATNYAVAISRMGQRSRLLAVASGIVERLGLLKALEDAGVDTSSIAVMGGSPGIVVVMNVIGGSHKSRVAMRGVNTRLPSFIEEGLRSWTPGSPCHIHLASIPPALLSSLNAAPAGCTSSYDPGGEAFRRGAELLAWLSAVDWVFINTSELKGLTGRGEALAAIKLLEAGARMVVVKHGSGGATLLSRTGCITVSRLPGVKPVDVTGAGDAFDAAFNIAVKAGADLGDALRVASAAGSAKVLKKGSSNMPSREEVEAMLRHVGEAVDCSVS